MGYTEELIEKLIRPGGQVKGEWIGGGGFSLPSVVANYLLGADGAEKKKFALMMCETSIIIASGKDSYMLQITPIKKIYEGDYSRTAEETIAQASRAWEKFCGSRNSAELCAYTILMSGLYNENMGEI